MENTIKIHFKNRDDYKNTYNERILSYKLSNYILEETKSLSTKEKIKFVISSNFQMEELEKTNLVDMIRNNFGADISELLHLNKKQIMANLLLLFTSIIVFIIYFLSSVEFISEVILVLGWVLLGEAICNFLYKGIEYRHKILRRKQIVNAKVTFE